MSESVFPSSTREFAQKRRELNSRHRGGLPSVQSESFLGWRPNSKDEADHRRCRRTCYPMSLLH